MTPVLTLSVAVFGFAVIASLLRIAVELYIRYDENIITDKEVPSVAPPETFASVSQQSINNYHNTYRKGA